MKTETHLPTPLKSEALSPQLVVAELATAIPLPSTILPPHQNRWGGIPRLLAMGYLTNVVTQAAAKYAQ